MKATALLVMASLVSVAIVRGHIAPHSTTVESNDPRLHEGQGALYLADVRFTGIVESHDDRGVLVASVPYVRGLQDGIARSWFSSGALRDERGYRRGREHGAHNAWWPNGKPRLQSEYRDTRREGTMKEWSVDGVLFHVGNYQDGAELGPQQMWNADGSIRANYVVRDGRRYGYMGAVGCTGGDSVSVREVVR